jgi:hypothetical protein
MATAIANASKIPTIRWEYSGLDRTSEVLMAVNPLWHPNAESIASYIQSLAFNYACECESNGEVPTMTGTGGFYVTFIPAESEDHDYNVEVTLMAYCVHEYLKSEGKI